jgi:hypothetical protein
MVHVALAGSGFLAMEGLFGLFSFFLWLTASGAVACHLLLLGTSIGPCSFCRWDNGQWSFCSGHCSASISCRICPRSWVSHLLPPQNSTVPVICGGSSEDLLVLSSSLLAYHATFTLFFVSSMAVVTLVFILLGVFSSANYAFSSLFSLSKVVV